MGLQAGARLGPYEIAAPLGAGGMGEVYRARDTRLGREVAVKVLPASLAADDDRLRRFEHEARAASALNHPNIVTIYDIGRENGTEFIAMELVDGKTLRELEASGTMAVRRLLGITAQVASGLAKAHEAGIVHRDLKPDNVMVSKDGFVKILDFGLAKLMGSEPADATAMLTVARPATDAGTVMGTVAYMSPEQASGEPVDYRSDQFSLGVVLYEMATGRKAFQRKTAAETMAAIIREEPEPVGMLRTDVPLALRWILERCLAKDREERYASTQDLARDLAKVRDHLSQVSTETGVTSSVPARRPGPRSRALIPLAGVSLLALGALAGWGVTRTLAPTASVAPSFVRLTFSAQELANARFAPDGDTVVYGARRVDSSRRTELYRVHIGSPESERFAFAGDILAISPSSDLVIRQGDGQTGTLARVPMAGGTPRQVLENVTYAGADLSPDGRDMAVVHIVDGKSSLEYPVGTTLVADNADTPRISPDGRSIAFWETRGAFVAVSIVDRSGTSKKILSQPWDGFAGAPCWSPDGREVWFTAGRPGQREALWAVDLSGRERLVTRVPGALELDDISKDGRLLIAHHTIVRRVRFASSSDPAGRELSWLDASVVADLSNDGKTLLLNEVGESTGSSAVVYLRGTDGSPAAKLGDGFGRALSPDGRWVLMDLPAAGGQGPRLALLPTGAGQTRALDPGGLSAFGWGAWLPDGKAVVFSASSDGHSTRLYVQAVPDGKPRPIGPEKASLQNWTSPVSPDGRFVVANRGGEFVLVPIDGHGEGRILAGVTPSAEVRVAQWTSDSRAVYVSQSDDRLFRVSLLDVSTGQRRPWRDVPHSEVTGLSQLRITRDGSAWVYSGRWIQSDLYAVEGLR